MRKITLILLAGLLLVGGCKKAQTNNKSLFNTLFALSNSKVNIASVVAVDSNDVELGKAVYINNDYMMLYTSTGHLCCVYWNGNILGVDIILYPNGLYYNGNSCTGTAFTQPGNSYMANTLYGKSVFSDGTNLYVPSTINPDGTAHVASAGIMTHRSLGGTCSGTVGTQNVIELATTTRSAIGLPDPIATPITLAFK